MINERLIFNPLPFVDGKDFVTIGANKINKYTYENHKKEFDSIILSGDEAWKKPLDQIELTQFIVKLSNNKIIAKQSSLKPLKKGLFGDENMNMNELAKQEEIKNGYDNIPEGMTKLKAESVQITPIEVEFNGVKKTRYELIAKTTEGKDVKFGCGVKIYNGLIALAKQGNIKTIYITRNGLTKENTTYTVAGE